jgi:glycosyltransferase involved in cell wall biosynthesis
MISTALKLKKIIEQYDIDIVQVNGSKDSWPFLYAKMFSKKKFKMVFRKPNSFKVGGRTSLWRHNEMYDGIIFVSQSAKDALGIENLKPYHKVIRNGIDLAYWTRKSPINTTPSKLRIVSNAGTSDYKRWINMVDAVLGLPEELRDRVELCIMGNANKETNELAGKYPNITFTGRQADTRPQLENGDVGFVLSNNIETISFACREMMAMSLPIIVSDFGGLKENVDASCGWITPVDNVEAIRQTVIDILNMPPEKLNEMKLAARRKAEAEFSIETLYKNTNEFYEELFKIGQNK